MAPPFPDGTRWHVVYTRPNSRTKLDGFLLLKYMTGNVVRKIILQDATSAPVADRFLSKDEHLPPVHGDLEIKSFLVHVDSLVEEFAASSGPRSLPARTSSSSFAPSAPSDGTPIGNVGTRCNKAASSIPWLRSNTSLAPRRVDRAPIAIVGTKWNVLYRINPNKKSKKMEDGILQLVQKNNLEVKVVLCDKLGRQIDEKFLKGDSMEIACGNVLQFDNIFVEVGDMESDSASVAEVVVIQDSPIDQKKLPWQHPRVSSQGSQAVTSRVPDPDIAEVIQDSGTRRVRAPLKPRGKQITAPKRRDSGQVMNSLKRPVNTSIRESSSTATSRTRDLVETEETFMLPSTTRRNSEEERPTTADCAGGFQKLYVGKARPESFDDECLFIKHEMKQQKNKFGNSRPGGIINLDDQFDLVVEQHEVALEMDGNEASPHTRDVFTKCSEEAAKVLDDKRFRVRDFWDGYKLYCFGYYDNCDLSKAEFLNSKMGQVVCLLHNEMDVRWGAKFDETVRQVWAMMEEYVKVRCGKDCTNLRALMEEFEDVKKLATSEKGSLLLQLIKDDEHGSECLYKHSRNIEIQSTNVFDEFRSRLNQVDSNLGSLIKSSAKSSEHSSETLNDLDKRSVGSKNSREKGPVSNTADRRSKPAERCKNVLPSFDLGF